MMMRKKTKMAWSVALSAAMDCLQDAEVMEDRKVRVEALPQVLPRQNLLPVIQQIPVTAQPTKLQR